MGDWGERGQAQAIQKEAKMLNKEAQKTGTNSTKQDGIK